MKKFFRKHKQKIVAGIAILVAAVMVFGSVAMFFV